MGESRNQTWKGSTWPSPGTGWPSSGEDRLSVRTLGVSHGVRLGLGPARALCRPQPVSLPRHRLLLDQLLS